MQKTTKTGKIFKDISILIYGNVVINELSLRQRAVNNFLRIDMEWPCNFGKFQ